MTFESDVVHKFGSRIKGKFVTKFIIMIVISTKKKMLRTYIEWKWI